MKKWLPNKFNYGAKPEEIEQIQERVQARHKNKEMMDMLKKSANKQSVVPTEVAVIMGLYMHTSYEMGREAAYNDIDHMMDETLEKQFHPKCPHCGTTEMLCGHHGVGCNKDPKDGN